MSKTFKTEKGTELPISDIRGRSYLEVKHRLVWFREVKPLWGIETHIIEVSKDSAIVNAVIKDEQGRILATAHKHENKQGFGDFLEKAETGAIGRALALVGFGTQFTGDELEEGERLADSPIAHRNESAQFLQEVKWADDAGLIRPPKCCNRPMMVSKFNEEEWFCPQCKKKQKRAA